MLLERETIDYCQSMERSFQLPHSAVENMFQIARSLRLSYVLTRKCLEGHLKSNFNARQINNDKGVITTCSRKYSSDEKEPTVNEDTKDEDHEKIIISPPSPEGGSYLSGRSRYKNYHKEYFSPEKVEAILDELYKENRIDDDMPTPDILNPYQKEPKRCILCKHNVELNWKNVRLLSQFVSPHTGRIYNRGITGLCKPMQFHIATLIKRARHLGFMPYLYKTPEYLDDPKILSMRGTSNSKEFES